MDQNSDQIVNEIERQRDELGRDLDELQSKVRGATDWKAQFEKHPYYFIGAAFGGGLLLSSIAGGRSSRDDYSSASYPEPRASYSYSEPGPSSSSYESSYESGFSRPSSSSGHATGGTAYQKHRAMHTLDSIKGALIAFAATKAKDMLAEMLPGFDRHLEETQKYSGRQGGMSSEADSSSMSSPSATHGSGTSSGSSTYGGPTSQGKPTTGGSYGSGAAPVSGGSFQSPGASPWSGSGADIKPSESSKL